MPLISTPGFPDLHLQFSMSKREKEHGPEWGGGIKGKREEGTERRGEEKEKIKRKEKQ